MSRMRRAAAGAGFRRRSRCRQFGLPQDPSELAWLRGITAGLFLILICSIWALQVTLVMRIGPLSLAAVNFPGPKVSLTVTAAAE